MGETNKDLGMRLLIILSISSYSYHVLFSEMPMYWYCKGRLRASPVWNLKGLDGLLLVKGGSIVDSLSECSIMELPIRFQNFYIPLPLSSLIVTKQKCCYCQLIMSRDI